MRAYLRVASRRAECPRRTAYGLPDARAIEEEKLHPLEKAYPHTTSYSLSILRGDCVGKVSRSDSMGGRGRWAIPQRDKHSATILTKSERQSEARGGPPPPRRARRAPRRRRRTSEIVTLTRILTHICLRRARVFLHSLKCPHPPQLIARARKRHRLGESIPTREANSRAKHNRDAQ